MDHFRPQLGRLKPEKRERDREELLRRIPTEDSIKQRFKMRIPVQVEAMENPISSIHVMEHPKPGINIIEDHAACIVRDLGQLRKEEAVLQAELNDFAKKTGDELDQMKSYMMEKFASFWSQLRQDSVDHQNGLVPIHKEIQKVRNIKTELIDCISDQFDRVYKLEDALFKQQVFDLQANDPELVHPERHILRREHAHLPNYGSIMCLSQTHDRPKEKKQTDDFDD